MAHGSGDTSVLAPRSRFYQGPFGRIFPNLDPWSPPGVAEGDIPEHLLGISKLMVEAPNKTPQDAINDTVLRNGPLNSTTLPVGYTYFGQFIDHDITFDPASSLMRGNDPEGLLNHRTPRFDLDCVYGRGPDDSPYLYDAADPAKFLIATIPDSALTDLPRNNQGRALIGDPRNDENAIVSQLHLAFLRAHNTLVDRARLANAVDPFEAARTTLRWLYQHIVWHDFVQRVTLPDVHAAALELKSTPDGRSDWNTGLDDVYKWKNNPFIPVEFSVAAYRFGHSMVRNEYQTNNPHRGFGNFAPIFDNTDPTNPDPDDLRGFRPMTIMNSVQWDWFLTMESSTGPFPQMGRKIDSKLANALSALHADKPGSRLNILAFRNLLRGFRFGLPSGTAVARRLGVTPLSVAPEQDALWFYILKEAEGAAGPTDGEQLGRVGSIIVAATFAGLLKGDPKAWINVRPTWTPDDDPLLRVDDKRDEKDGKWRLSAIIRLSGLPVKGDDFPQ
jgi:hypothetical protein